MPDYSKRMVQALENERRKIAEMLHDDVGQVLTSLSMVLKRARQQGDLMQIGEAEAMVSELLERVRLVSANLRPHILDRFGLGVAVRWHVKTFSKRTNIPVSLRITKVQSDLPPDLSTTVFRFVQEALTNVARHSKAKKGVAIISQRDGRVSIEVRDDGRGFNPDKLQKGSSGLISLRERILLSGGEFLVTSQLNRGTTLRAELPIPQKTAKDD